ncbi:MAG: hypothetical protein RL527_807 [Planctomycetota bacterium]|jgi:hypothetical protein
MSTAPANPAAQIDDPEPVSTWVVSIVGTLLIVATIVFVCCVYFIAAEREFTAKVVDAPDLGPAALKAEQQALLGGYGSYTMTDAAGKERKTIRIPVEKAMEALVAEGIKPSAAPAPAVPAAANP